MVCGKPGVKLGLIGPGRHGKRYLEPQNGGERFVGSAGSAPGAVAALVARVDAVVIATPPATHEELTMLCLEAGKPVLVEKPLALDLAACERLVAASERLGVPLMVAHTHLWARLFQSLERWRLCEVSWCGPEREDGSCPAWLDWGAHAHAMGVALGTSRIHSAKMAQRLTVATDGVRVYRGGTEPGESPMHAMVETFLRVCRGDRDWRSMPAFTRSVYRSLFAGRESVVI